MARQPFFLLHHWLRATYLDHGNMPVPPPLRILLRSPSSCGFLNPPPWRGSHSNLEISYCVPTTSKPHPHRRRFTTIRRNKPNPSAFAIPSYVPPPLFPPAFPSAFHPLFFAGLSPSSRARNLQYPVALDKVRYEPVAWVFGQRFSLRH